MPKIICSTIFALCLALNAGCGPKQVSISGSVTWDGKPVEKGAINFFPVAGGGTAGAAIKAGKFTIDQDRGAVPGKYRVEILGYRGTGKKEFDADLNRQIELEEQFLPQKYNYASELTAEIAQGKPNDLEFHLKK